MKTVSNDLFRLIKSLSKQEKRYFKLHASRHVIGKQNKYVLLFDAIDAQKAYDEVKIKKKFEGEAFTRQLHVAKNYLYQLILASLRNFHETNWEDKFYTWMRDAQLLYDKGLYAQSEKALNKAKRSAMDNERFLQLLEIYRWEHQIAHNQSDFKRLGKYLDTGIEEEFDLIDKYKNFLEFQALNDQVFLPYWKKGAIRNETEKEALLQLFKQPLFQHADNAKSFFARHFYHNARFSYHLFIGELQESYEHILQLVEMFEQLEASKIKGKMVRYYSSALINLYIVQQRLGKFDEIPQTLKQLRQMPADSPEQRRRLFVRSFNLEVDLYLSTGQFQRGVSQIKELTEQFSKYQKNINKQQRLNVFYNLSYLYFGAADYDAALDWINLLLNDPELKTREDIHCFGRLLNLIIHFELGNDQLLEYIVKSTYRFLSNRKRLFKVESVMLKLLRHYPKWIDSTQIRKGFSGLLEELEALKTDEFENRAFEYFDFTAWMQSQISEQSFEQRVRSKQKQP